jgi:tetraacyldisaccharide 4'-kinase
MKGILSGVYGQIVQLRTHLYARGFFRSESLRDPVISVGNLTVGGTGKTPFVAFLAKLLQDSGRQPVILSRGYKGRAQRTPLLVSDGKSVLCRPVECGDEPYLLARKLPGVPIVVGKSRAESGQYIETRFRKVIHILDDGFQHLQLRRDLDILLLDGTDPFGGGAMLPAGRLREPEIALKRADMILLTRSHLLKSPEEIELRIRRISPLVPITYFYHDAVGLLDLCTQRQVPVHQFLNRRVVAMAAIGNPQVFLNDLSHYQIRVVRDYLFRDHHAFTQSELDGVLHSLDTLGAEAVITTEKDAVRLQDLEYPAGRVLALQIEPRPENIPEYSQFLLQEVAALDGGR